MVGVLGIDPGLKGGIASWDGSKPEGQKLCCVEIPAHDVERGRGRELWIPELISLLDKFFMWTDVVYIEKVASRPKQGVASMFKFGKVYGTLLGIAYEAGKVVHEVPPKTWKKAYGLGSDKEQSIRTAEVNFPGHEHNFYGPRGGLRDGVAEAALIAKYGYQQEERKNGEV